MKKQLRSSKLAAEAADLNIEQLRDLFRSARKQRESLPRGGKADGPAQKLAREAWKEAQRIANEYGANQADLWDINIYLQGVDLIVLAQPKGDRLADGSRRIACISMTQFTIHLSLYDAERTLIEPTFGEYYWVLKEAAEMIEAAIIGDAKPVEDVEYWAAYGLINGELDAYSPTLGVGHTPAEAIENAREWMGNVWNPAELMPFTIIRETYDRIKARNLSRSQRADQIERGGFCSLNHIFCK